VTAVAAALLLFVQLRRESPRPSPAMSSAEFVTDTAEMATARLDDGSVVRLAPSSRLRVSSGTQDRENWLDGHAFFAVAADKSRPFRVRTRAGIVEVLGTRFDLKVEGTELQLVVTEGRVALNAANERHLVVAGETGRVSADGVVTVSRTVDAPELLHWTRNFLVFQDTPLHQVARELEARYGVRVLVPDSALGERTVTAWFTQQNLDQVLQAVCRAVQAHCRQANGMASIEP
jgi:transmembrane sensor